MNLLTDSWIPVVRKNSAIDEISPLQLLDDLPENPVVSLHTVRPDFDGALLQFLIGIYQVLLSPGDEDEWRDLLDASPSRTSLAEKINLISPAFEFDGDKFRFMQDGSVEGTDEWNISKLLIDINNSHFVKEGRVQRMCPKCAALALLTLELNSPSGGRGHMTSLRGGGPLTTLVTLPADRMSLWKTIVLNLITEDFYPDSGTIKPSPDNITKIFPWLDSMPNSENGEVVVPKDLHPYHVFWNVPRRVWIDFSKAEDGHCDLCGEKTASLLSAYWSRPMGIKYESWMHPLTPYNLKKTNTEELILPIHGKENGMSYVNWVGVVLGSSDNSRVPAAVVRRTLNNLYGDTEYSDLKIHVFGYAMDKAKARLWQEGILPTIVVAPEINSSFMYEAEKLVTASSEIAKVLVSCIKDGSSSDSRHLKGDFSDVRTSFWNKTEDIFYATLSKFQRALTVDFSKTDAETAVTEVKTEWLNEVRRITLDIFKEWVNLPTLGGANPALAAHSELNLRRYLTGNNSNLCKVLGLPVKVKKSRVKP